MELIVTFDRIGQSRNRRVTLTDVSVSTEKGRDEIAQRLFWYCQTFMPSPMFTVTVDFTARAVWVEDEGGEAGRGMLQVPRN